MFSTVSPARPRPLIYTQDWEIDARLVPFEVTRSELVEVVRGVFGARADAVDNDPLSAEGLFAYIFGTRLIRAAWRRQGWHLYRAENVESVRHPERDWLIAYQSVDLACSVSHDPQAISGKGSGSDRFIGQAEMSFEIEGKTSEFKPENVGAWYFCVSVNGEDVRAELSRPIGLTNGNFAGFYERIFIVRGDEWPQLSTVPLPTGGATEFEPVVTRKV